jgi:ABC-type transport system substrate-binding protein
VIPEAFGYDPNIKPYPYDLARAKKLLAEAGYAKVGFDTTIGRHPAPY